MRVASWITVLGVGAVFQACVVREATPVNPGYGYGYGYGYGFGPGYAGVATVGAEYCGTRIT